MDNPPALTDLRQLAIIADNPKHIKSQEAKNLIDHLVINHFKTSLATIATVFVNEDNYTYQVELLWRFFPHRFRKGVLNLSLEEFKLDAPAEPTEVEYLESPEQIRNHYKNLIDGITTHSLDRITTLKKRVKELERKEDKAVPTIGTHMLKLFASRIPLMSTDGEEVFLGYHVSAQIPNSEDWYRGIITGVDCYVEDNKEPSVTIRFNNLPPSHIHKVTKTSTFYVHHSSLVKALEQGKHTSKQED